MSEFNPSAYEGKPRHLPKHERQLLSALLDAVKERMAAMSDREQDELLAGCLNVSPINCGWDEYAIAGIVYHSLSFDIAARDSGGGAEREDSRSEAEAESPQSGPNADSGIAQPQSTSPDKGQDDG